MNWEKHQRSKYNHLVTLRDLDEMQIPTWKFLPFRTIYSKSKYIIFAAVTFNRRDAYATSHVDA